MAMYSTLVRTVLESLAGNNANKNNPDDVIRVARPRLFTFEYPLYDEAYKPVLETKILRRYYFREIGFETVPMWKFYLETRLNEIMPYYNQLYKSEMLEFNPLYDTNITVTHKKDNTQQEGLTHGENSTGKTKGNSSMHNEGSDTNKTSGWTSEEGNGGSTVTENGSNTQLEKFADTPQNGVASVLQEDNFLTSARNTESAIKDHITGTQWNESRGGGNLQNTEGTNKQDGTAYNNLETSDNKWSFDDRNLTNTENYIQRIEGKRGVGSYSKRVKEFRDNMLNIDKMIIDELQDLFFMLYN